MKITKTAKKIKLIQKESVLIRTHYDCPTCKTRYVGVINPNIIQFYCDGGQKLTVGGVKKA